MLGGSWEGIPKEGVPHVWGPGLQRSPPKDVLDAKPLHLLKERLREGAAAVLQINTPSLLQRLEAGRAPAQAPRVLVLFQHLPGRLQISHWAGWAASPNQLLSFQSTREKLGIGCGNPEGKPRHRAEP